MSIGRIIGAVAGGVLFAFLCRSVQALSRNISNDVQPAAGVSAVPDLVRGVGIRVGALGGYSPARAPV